MANITIDDLVTTAIADVTATHYLAIDNGTTTTKLAALDLTIQEINTLGSGAGVAKTYSLGTLTQRGIVAGTNALTVAESANDVTLTVVPGNINITQLSNISDFDLNLADNTNSGFLSTVDLTSDVTGILPVANGGTGLGTLPDNSVLIGNGTSAIDSILMTTNLNVVAGSPTGPAAYTLTAGDNINIIQNNTDDTITIAASATLVENGDSPSFVDLTITNDITINGDTSVQDICINDALQMDAATVTQTSSLNTNVTLNKAAGRINLYAQTLAADTGYQFTLTNSYITTESVILLTLVHSGPVEDINVLATLGDLGNGSCEIQLTHLGATQGASATRQLHFLVIQDCTANP
jgi:hypothetical protein